MKTILLLFFCFFFNTTLFSQENDENSLTSIPEYEVLSAENFDIYFSQESLASEAQKSGETLEKAYQEFTTKLNFHPSEKTSLFLYFSTNPFLIQAGKRIDEDDSPIFYLGVTRDF